MGGSYSPLSFFVTEKEGNKMWGIPGVRVGDLVAYSSGAAVKQLSARLRYAIVRIRVSSWRVI